MENINTVGSTAVGTVGIAPEVRVKLEVDTRNLVARANALEITNEMQNTEALKTVASLKTEIKNRKAILAPSKTALDATKAAYDGLVAMMIKPLEQCAEIIKGRADTFIKQENARRAELQRQEDERVAAAQRKEDARVAALQAKEDARVAEAQRKANEKYEAARLKAEEEAKAQGKTSAAPMAPPPVITSNKIIAPAAIIPMRTVAKVSVPAGTGASTLWRAEIKDLPALLRAIADGTEPQYLVEIKMAELNSRATGIKQEGAVIAPGVIAVSKVSTSLRG